MTITGPAGCGKTRLALRAAWELRPYFPEGVYFVPLGSVGEPDNLLWAIADYLRLQFVSKVDARSQLADHLKDKNLLLVMDNFEHLVAAADVLSDILRSAPRIRILVTPRERLNLYGEAVWLLQGMPVPDTQDLNLLRKAEAVSLFLERAQAVNPAFEAADNDMGSIARICQLVEGLPLGIELAATWINVLSPKDIADELEHSLDLLETNLRGTPDSHTSMRAAFERSWLLLDTQQQAALCHLTVFRGGFTRQAAQHVAGVNLRTLQALVEKSLLQTDPASGRFDIHQLLHLYAAEKLAEAEEADQAYRAHATYFAEFMAARWQDLKGHRQQAALQEIGAEIDNVRAAWAYWIKAEDVDQIGRFLHDLWVIYDIKGWYPAGIALFEQAIKVMRLQGTPDALAYLGWLLAAQGLYYAVGGFYNVKGGYRSGYALAQEGIEILGRLDVEGNLMIVPLISLCICALQLGKQQEAQEAAQSCLEIATNSGDSWGIAKAKQFLAVQAIDSRRYTRAKRLSQEALSIFEQHGDHWSESVVCIEVLGLLAIVQRQLDSAAQWIRRGLEAAEAINFDYSVQMAYWQLGYIEALRENFSRAGQHWEKALEVGGDRILGTGVTIGFGGTSRNSDWAKGGANLPTI